MLKLKNFFLMGLLAVSMGVFGLACDETPDEPEGYTATAAGGGKIYNDATGKYELTSAIFYKDDPVDVFVFADDVPDGKEFDYWQISGAAVTFADGYDETDNPTAFAMPARNITITAKYVDLEDDTPYTASITDGFIYNDHPDVEDYTLTSAIFFVGDDVDVRVTADIPDGMLFDKWEISGRAVTFLDGTDEYSSTATFSMPARDIQITATFFDPQPYVRFSWRATDQANIVAISANYNEVLAWYQDVYMDEDYIEEDATDVPINIGKGGSKDLPLNIYSSTLQNTNYKSTWLPIDVEDGELYTTYTAICEVYDAQYDSYVDIVANYDVNSVEFMRDVAGPYLGLGSAMQAFLNVEVAFDVENILADTPDEDWEVAVDPSRDEAPAGWFYGITDDQDDDPILQKKPAKKLVKKVKKGNVTYYVLHRAKKV